jgi:hypothetical protein
MKNKKRNIGGGSPLSPLYNIRENVIEDGEVVSRNALNVVSKVRPLVLELKKGYDYGH